MALPEHLQPSRLATPALPVTSDLVERTVTPVLPEWSRRSVAARPPLRGRPNRRLCAQHGAQPHVVGEAVFREAFKRERRRSERFEQVFATFALDVGDQTPVTMAAVLRAAGAVADPDAIVGWVREGCELGILFPTWI